MSDIWALLAVPCSSRLWFRPQDSCSTPAKRDKLLSRLKAKVARQFVYEERAVRAEREVRCPEVFAIDFDQFVDLGNAGRRNAHDRTAVRRVDGTTRITDEIGDRAAAPPGRSQRRWLRH